MKSEDPHLAAVFHQIQDAGLQDQFLFLLLVSFSAQELLFAEEQNHTGFYCNMVDKSADKYTPNSSRDLESTYALPDVDLTIGFSTSMLYVFPSKP